MDILFPGMLEIACECSRERVDCCVNVYVPGMFVVVNGRGYCRTSQLQCIVYLNVVNTAHYYHLCSYLSMLKPQYLNSQKRVGTALIVIQKLRVL